MAVVEELIRTEADATLSFGDDTLAEKTKKSDYEFDGDLYKVKTFSGITKLERNGMFVYESVPGTAVFGFSMTGDRVTFDVMGHVTSQITIEMESATEYEIFVDGQTTGIVRTNLGGKLTFHAPLEPGKKVSVLIRKR